MKKKKIVIPMVLLGATFGLLLSGCKTTTKKTTTSTNPWARPTVTTTANPTTTTTPVTTTAPQKSEIDATEVEYDYTLNSNYYTISQILIPSGVKKVNGTIIIPEEYEGLPVKTFKVACNSDVSIDISIGKNIESIVADYYYDIENINSLAIDSDNEYVKIDNNTILTKDGKKIILSLNANTFVCPQSAEKIGQYAYLNTNFKTANIPSNIKQIGNYSFGSNLEEVTFNEGLEQLDYGSFYYSNKIKNVLIPSTVNKIGNQSFVNLDTLSVASSNTVYDSRDNCNAIIETSQNRLVLGSKNLKIPASVTTIGSRAFAYSRSITSLTIPSTVTAIEEGAFIYCYNLETLKILNKTVAFQASLLSNSMFEGCGKLESLYIPQNYSIFDEYSLSGNRNLKMILVSNISSIHDKTFSPCQKLEKIFFGQSKNEIDTNFSTLGTGDNNYNNITKYYYVATKALVDSTSDYNAWTFEDDFTVYTKDGLFSF